MAKHKIYDLIDQDGQRVDQKHFDKFANTLMIVSQKKEIYDQIRYLDLDGNEVVRINFNNGRAMVVPQEQLQNKGHRYYFKAAAMLNSQRIYVSPLDLNMEHGQIEVPFKPMLRLASPIYDADGRKRGIVIINYLASYLMNGLKLFDLHRGTNYMLINSDGHFLFNNLKPELEFAFMFDHKSAETVYHQFPDFADKIRMTQFGQFETSQGIVTIESVRAVGRINPYCFQEYHVTSNTSTSWKLLSYVEYNNRIGFHDRFTQNQSLVYSGIFLSALFAYLIDRYQLRLHIDNQRIFHLAHNDFLTSLVNRAAFQNGADSILSACTKSSKPACLIYIDLDDFKFINDEFGHAAGDKALKYVADVMRKVLGERALLARLGGDEFAILLSHPEHMEDPEKYAALLIQMIQCPFEVQTNIYHQVNASIGGCYVREGDSDLDGLMHRADMAMYEAKRAGKNRYYFI
uniref:sensor domain-containing diguanylate cyclase n=1 Tax=Vibrio alfacsensis TaxID=1074311 RepID=UPI001F494E6F|nr:sensor domain-containing diguanylate cyclase [Vibrio alfacsensis]